MNLDKFMAWCAENGDINPRDSASMESYLAANPKAKKATKERRQVMIRVKGRNDEGDFVVFTDTLGCTHEVCDNIKEKRDFVGGIMLLQAQTEGALTDCFIQRAYVPEWVELKTSDD